jgi:hypothetical protein
MKAPRDGTMALCATCHRAIYCWRDIPLAVFEHDGQDIYMSGLPTVHWTHFCVPERKHDAMPMPSVTERTLMCAGCRQPQTRMPEGWWCMNPHCPSRVDKD